MAHFAEINALKKVVRVLAVDNNDTLDNNGNEDETVGAEYLSKEFGGTWLRTSYNTARGAHQLGGTPFRKNYAGIGYTYDETRNAFIPPKPYPSWTLNESTCSWESPVAYPDDGKIYEWDEETTDWVEAT
tara:strand:- start:661 stop:1050 length:390 start_codon:yes stop_codon:yes gene_type:complete